jgi:RNA-directed DNA polymerase
LTLSEEKTRITPIEEGFDFLGQNVRKYRRKLLMRPAKKNRQRFLNRMRDLLKRQKDVPAWAVIIQLNPIIRGWAQYHRHSASKRTFAKVDHAIFQAI